MATQPMVHRFRSTGRFTQVHVDVFDGRMTPTVWDDGGGPESFEVEIGNRVAYAAPLKEAGTYFRELQSQWLPYYGEDLRLSRLAMVREACARDLDAIAFFLGRGLYFQAFDRLYKAFQEFLQALFVARRTYPLAYNKWIREQVRWLHYVLSRVCSYFGFVLAALAMPGVPEYPVYSGPAHLQRHRLCAVRGIEQVFLEV